MCLICHDDKKADALIAHGDGIVECIRIRQTEPPTTEFKGSSYLDEEGNSYYCVDCGDLVRAMDKEDHCCYE